MGCGGDGMWLVGRLLTLEGGDSRRGNYGIRLTTSQSMGCGGEGENLVKKEKVLNVFLQH